MELRLIIELDGGRHAVSKSDKKRTEQLERDGYRVIRFWNSEVPQNLDSVLQRILEVVSEVKG